MTSLHLSGIASALVALYGLIVGSFLNVVIARLPLDQSVITPGSRCPKCGAGLQWHENIPVLSFVFLKAKCRTCANPISFRYPLVELLTALLFCAAAVKGLPTSGLQ
jgi:leader peptidase (prepilin peptidase)/N-methyltransferase